MKVMRELAVGLTRGEQKFRMIPVMIGSMKPCMKTASQTKTKKRLKSEKKGQGMQKRQNSN